MEKPIRIAGDVLVHPERKECPSPYKDPEGYEQWHKECERLELDCVTIPQFVQDWFIEEALDRRERRQQEEWEAERELEEIERERRDRLER
jgi:hypothetical protein